MRRIILSVATVLFSMSVAGSSVYAGEDCKCDHKAKAGKEECAHCHKKKGSEKDCKDGKCKHEQKAEEKKAE